MTVSALLRRVRAELGLRDIPVILLSARAGEEARIEGLDLGADDYLTKPFSARELIARVNTNLELARVRREVTWELRESEARFRNMADHAPVMMWMTDASGSLTYLIASGAISPVRRWTKRSATEHGTRFTPRTEPFSERIFFTANAARRHFALNIDCATLMEPIVGRLAQQRPGLAMMAIFSATLARSSTSATGKRAEQVLRQANEDLELRVAAAVADRAQAEAQLRQAQKMEAVGSSPAA